MKADELRNTEDGFLFQKLSGGNNFHVNLSRAYPFRVKRAGFFAGQKRKLRGKYCLLAGFRLHL